MSNRTYYNAPSVERDREEIIVIDGVRILRWHAEVFLRAAADNRVGRHWHIDAKVTIAGEEPTEAERTEFELRKRASIETSTRKILIDPPILR